MNLSGDAIKSSGCGFFYGLAMQTVLYPFEVVKVLQQDPLCNKKCDQIVLELFRKKGLKAFYEGLTPKLVEKGHHHLWRWPLIMQLPPLLDSRGYNETQQQVLTGGGLLERLMPFLVPL